jgi:hypothetical protein
VSSPGFACRPPQETTSPDTTTVAFARRGLLSAIPYISAWFPQRPPVLVRRPNADDLTNRVVTTTDGSFDKEDVLLR